MDEKKEETETENKEEATPKADATPTKDEGVQSKTVETLDRADEIVERRKRENDREEAILERKEALAARQAVGGELDAGQEPEKKEETPAEYATKVKENAI